MWNPDRPLSYPNPKTMKKLTAKSLKIFALVLGLGMLSCSKETPIDPAPKSDITYDSTVASGLAKVELLQSYTALSLQQTAGLAAFQGINLDVSKIKYGVDVYKLTYKTNYKGKLISASGLVALPTGVGNKALPLFSFQHGTMVKKSEAPSANHNDLITQIELMIPAAMGSIASLPDYLGFGASANYFHPYYVAEPNANSIIDHILAAKKLASQKGISSNDKLFLVGYSEGGYTTMATHRALESNARGLDLVASFPAAGGYDLLGMQRELLARTTYEQPYYLGYVIQAHRDAYGYTNPSNSQIFASPYDALIPGLYDGSKDGGSINAALNTNIKQLFQPNFIQNFSQEAAFSNLRNSLIENSLLNWKPSKKMYLYHGTSDDWVFYSTSESTYQALLKNGGSQMEFIPLSGTHTSAINPYVNDVFQKLVQLMGL